MLPTAVVPKHVLLPRKSSSWMGMDAGLVRSPQRGKTPVSHTRTTTWIRELASSGKPLDPAHLVEKTSVSQQLRKLVEELDAHAWSVLCSNPTSLEDSFHETHYLVPKTVYTELEVQYGLNIERPASLETLSLDAEEAVDLSEIHFLELSLGSVSREFEQATRELHERLNESGISSEADFVAYFASHMTERMRLVDVAFFRCELLYQQLYGDYERRRGVIASQIPTAREGLITLFQCEHPEIKSHILDRLIDVLHADPLAPESYYNLPKDVQTLMALLALKSSQNLDESILSKLIEVFALCINNMWLYSNSESTKTSAIIEDSLRHSIWEAADELKKLNTKDNPSINFWINFALQAAQGIKTEVSHREELLGRVKHLALAVVGIVTIIGKSAAKEELDASQDEIESIISHISQVFYHIRSKEDWFEPLLAFKYMCHLVRYCPGATSSLVEMALHYKSKETDPNLFLGMVAHLESLIVHTSHAETTEACLKVLMTLIFFDNELIQKRIIQSLLRMKDIGRPTLSIASECLLHLIYQSHNSLREDFPSLANPLPLPVRFKSLSTLGQTLCSHVMALFIRFTVHIQTESGLSSESLLCQLTRSTTGDLDGDGTARVLDMMQALKSILPDTLTPDADGNGLLHLCIRRGNAKLLSSAFEVFNGLIDANAVNQEGRTALMLCLEPKTPPFLEGIEELAKIKGVDPNIRDKYGKTFVHYLVNAVISNAIIPADVEYILKNIRFTTRINMDARDADGYTPLMRCLKQDDPKSLKVASILIKAGAQVHIPDPNNITAMEMIICCGNPSLIKDVPTTQLMGSDLEYTCFVIATENGRENVLDYLFTALPDHSFSIVEALAIMKSAFLSFLKLREKDTVFPIIQKYTSGSKSHVPFLKACQQALPNFSWHIEGSEIKLTFNDDVISPEELQASITGRPCSEKAASVFRISTAMQKCFRSSKSDVSDLVEDLRRDPTQLRQKNILGRNMLQVALLEGDEKTIELILCYDRQHFDNKDHLGNQPLHYAAATLDPKAYRRILSKVGSSNGMPHNNMGLPPLVMALRLPERMFSGPTSDCNPYAQTYTPAMHENFCAILEDTLELYKEHNLLCHDREAAENPLNYRNPKYKWNILHYAAVYGTVDQAQEVAKKLPDLFFDAHREGGRIPIEQALFRSRTDIASAMIRGWIFQQRNSEDPTPLTTLYEHLARQGLSLWSILAEVGAVDLIKVLSYEGMQLIDFEETSVSSRFRFSIGTDMCQYYMDFNPFAVCVQTAIRRNDIALLTYLAETFPAQMLSLKDEAQNTPLMLATRMHRVDSMRILISLASTYGVLDSYIGCCNISGQAVIHILCCTPRTSALEQIIATKGLSLPESQEILNQELTACMDILLAAGANLLHRDGGGNTALHLICGHNHEALLHYIYSKLESLSSKEFNRYFNALNDDKRSPIFAAVANASMEVFRALIAIRRLRRTEELRLDLRDINGLSLLHLSAQEGQAGQIEICQTLVEQGIDIQAIDEKGETAIHKAAFNRRLEILDYLLRLAAASPVRTRLMAADFSQMTALHKAILLPPALYRRSLRRHCEQRLLTASDMISPKQASTARLSSPGERVSSPASGAADRVFSSPVPILESSSLTAQALAPYENLLLASTGSRLLTRDQFDATQIDLINKVIIKLLDFGFSMEAQDQQGLTPWHYLMRGPYHPMLVPILAYFATRKTPVPFSTLRSHAGETVAHVAAKFGQVNQLDLVSRMMSSAALNSKTKQGLTAVALALLGEHMDCVDKLVALECRLDRSSRPQKHVASTPKGNNLLHIIAQKRSLNERLVALFEFISARHPVLLKHTGAGGKTVLEELAYHGHIKLIPLSLMRMRREESSREAIGRALTLVQSRISTLRLPSPAEAASESVKESRALAEALTILRLILNFGDLQRELGIGLGSFGKVRLDVAPISIEALRDRAITVQGSTSLGSSRA
jgi:ankyrin repeat protein